MRNIEIKAVLRDLAAARKTAEAVATSCLGVQHQIDTYFFCQRGRLKLREIDGVTAQLVSYERPDQAGPKGSDYTLVPIAEPALLKTALTAALSVRRVVDKRREVFLADNVRIHLDDVAGLGAFLEFEAVLDDRHDEAAGLAQVERLMKAFGITEADLLEGSYGDADEEIRDKMERKLPGAARASSETKLDNGQFKQRPFLIASEETAIIAPCRLAVVEDHVLLSYKLVNDLLVD